MNLALTSQSGAVVPAGDPLPAVPQFGAKANTVRYITLALDTATTDKRFPITGTRIKVVSATSLSAAVTVKFQDQSVDGLPMSKGSGIRGVRFDTLYISWDAQAGATLTLLVAVESADKIEIDDPAEDYTSVTLSRATQFLPFVDGGGNNYSIAAAAQLQIPAYSARRSITIRNHPDNTNRIHLSDSFVSATAGYVLLPGESFTIDNNTADIYIMNINDTADGTATTVCIIGSFD